MPKRKPKVVVIGAGFGGLELCKSLKNKPVDILLIDKNNYHTFIPLLYQVATGGLEANNVGYPIRRIFRKAKNLRFQMAEVERILPDKNQLQTSLGAINYDYLVIATGSTTNYFGLEDSKEKLMTLKSIPDALDIRSYVMQNLEKAVATYDPQKQEQLMNIAIVGAGPSGVEMAGALAEMRKYVFPRDFPQINFDKMTITLFEAAPQVLPGMSEKSSEKSLDYLEDLGIKVRLNTQVEAYENGIVKLADDSTFETDTVIWAAGVKGTLPAGIEEEHIKKKGHRILVDDFNQIEGMSNIFAIGDVAYLETEDYPDGLPMLAPVAIQQGKHLADNLVRLTKDKPFEKFSYFNKGTMAIIGRNKAVVDLPNDWKFQGTFAWLVWMFVHIITLVGFRNRLYTFLDWVQNYIGYDKPLGLIVRPFKPKKK